MAEKRVSKNNLKRFAENLKTNANILKRETSYNINETVNKGQVVLKCITAGITDKEAIDLSAVSVGDILIDGTAEWQVKSTTGYGSGDGGGTSVSEWATATSYEIGQIVIYGDSLYRCLADHASTTFSADEANWQLMFADIKEWTTNVYYKIGVAVIKDKQLYRCILNHTSSDFAEEVTNWQLIGGLPSWKPNTTYKKDSLVYSDGILYRVTQDFTSTTIFDETYLEPLTGGGGGSGGVKQVTKLGVIAPRDVEIEISPTNKFNMPPVEVLKLLDGTTNITTNALTFDAGDGSKFNVEGKVASESQLVIFDSTARPNHGIKYFFGETTKMVDNYYAESSPINLADFVDVEGVTLA